MIESMDVWHGPVTSFFIHEVDELVGDSDPTHIYCSESSINSVEDALSSWNLLDDEPTLIWMHDLHAWKADEVNKAMRAIKKSSDPVRVIITTQSQPVKSVVEAATSVKDFQPPKDKRKYAAQISNWMLSMGRGVEKDVASKLVSYCEPDPTAAQRVAVTLSSLPSGKAIDWETIYPLARDYVKEIRPIWELSNFISAGDVDKALNIIHVNDMDPLPILRYLENRYRLMTLVLDGASVSEVKHFNEKAGRWLLDSVREEAGSMTTKDCTLALIDIQKANTMVFEASGGAAQVMVLEHCVIKLSARHSRAKR